MNRTKSPNRNENSGTKRRLTPQSKEFDAEALDKSKTSTCNEEEEDEDEQESFRNRRSLRNKNKPSNSQSLVSPSQSAIIAKKQKETNGTNNNNKIKSQSSSSSLNLGSDRKLNGAQFVAAAAAGNFNVSASIGTTSITIDSNSNQDLTQLSHNVETLTKTLSQHSILLKQLNGKIEKLSNKLDLSIGNKKSSNQKSRQSKPAKKQKTQSIDAETNEDESFEEQLAENEKEREEDEDEEEDQEETINKSQQVNQPEASKELQEAKSELNQTELLNISKESEKSPIKQHETVANNEPVTQTVKLTNIDQISEENPRQSNSFYYLSDSSKSDDDDDNDDEFEEDETNQEGKKNRRSSHGLKSPTKAILNKTKIDTEFISKLIANKDPNDKRYDPNEINKLRLLSHSYQNFAVKLLMRLFDEDEIIGRNVYGRNYSGDKSFMKQPLDPERINFIKETVLKLTKTNNPDLAWASCVIAMNRKMVDINNKFIKSHKNE